MAKIDTINYGFTEKGNPYKKSNLAEKIGTIAGSGTAATFIIKDEIKWRKEPIGFFNLYKAIQKNSLKDVLSNIVVNYSEKAARLAQNPTPYNAKTANKLFNFYNNNAKSFSKTLELLKNNENFYNIINKTPGRRVMSFIIPGLAGAWALQFGGAIVGKLIGKGIDAVDNKIAANRADRSVEMEEAE